MVEQPEQSEKLLLSAATSLKRASGADDGGTTSCPARRPLSRPRIAARRRVAAALVALHAADAVDAADGAAAAAAAAMT